MRSRGWLPGSWPRTSGRAARVRRLKRGHPSRTRSRVGGSVGPGADGPVARAGVSGGRYDGSGVGARSGNRAGSSENISGAFETGNEIPVYVMTAVPFERLGTSGTFGGYERSSGRAGNGTIDDTLTSGEWDRVLLNTNPYAASGVVIAAPVVRTKA